MAVICYGSDDEKYAGLENKVTSVNDYGRRRQRNKVCYVPEVVEKCACEDEMHEALCMKVSCDISMAGLVCVLIISV